MVERIRKPATTVAQANLRDYEQSVKTFSWTDARRSTS